MIVRRSNRQSYIRPPVPPPPLGAEAIAIQPTIGHIEILLLTAAVVAIISRRLRVPYMVGLVLAGIGLSLLPDVPDIRLTKDLMFTAFLPPLIFEAALYIRWRELRADLPVILTLATVGVLISAAVAAAGMRAIVGWPLSSAVLFGVLIAATDPVAVIAAFKESGVHGRLRLLAEAESLFNDATASVAFAIVLAVITGGPVTAPGAVGALVSTVGGGIVCGLVVAGGVLLIAGRSEDHLVEITLTTATAYGAFLVAEHFHLSGVLATLTAGLVIGNAGALGSFSPKGQAAVESFWEYAAFVANSLIFTLMGIQVARQSFGDHLLPVGVAVVLVVGGRALAIYPLCFLFRSSRHRVTLPHQHALFWGGMRGALALALALGLPPDLPEHDAIVTVAYGVVALSVLVQGLTIIPLLRRMGELPSTTAAGAPATAD